MRKLSNVQEVAEVLNVPVSWVYQKTAKGQEGIPHVKIGKYLRFDIDEVIKFFKPEANQ